MKIKTYSILFLLFITLSGFSQDRVFFEGFEDEYRDKNSIRLMFYNLENFFDTRNDSLTSDDDYSSYGMKHWGKEKYNKKLTNIYKVIISIGGWEPPEIIGVCEVENKFVLGDIVYGTPLRKFNYRYIHYESPDSRGIDVALIYRPEKFKPVFHQTVTVVFPFDTSSKTRDILYVKGLLPDNDTLHVFVNHFPSKYGGASISIPKRNYVASLLKTKVDSIQSCNSNAKILIMGDFNDEPTDESIVKYLDAKCDLSNLKNNDLINLMCNLKKSEKIGTNKFRDEWSVIDQIIVSNTIFGNQNSWKIKNNRAYIFKASFLLQADENFLGLKTIRTYNGPRYTGGFSDHLPVFVDLIKN